MANVTNVTKHFPTAKEGFSTTTSSTVASGATTVPLTSVTGLTDGDTVALTIEPDTASEQVFTGVVDTSGSQITGVKWTEGINATHTAGSTVVDYVSATHMSMLTKGLLVSHNQDGSSKAVFDVTSPTYGATGDGVTDDSTAIQAAVDAAIAAGGGVVHFPSGLDYLIGTGISIDPSTLTSPLQLAAYGSKFSYSGASDAFTILTNIAVSDVQHAERSVHMEGFHIVASGSAGSANSAIHNKSTFFTLRNSVIEDFTTTTSQQASIIMDASFHYWVEECHIENVDIKNTGNGICFISQDDSGGTSASAANNSFTNVHIWLTQAGGKGVYGVGLGASTLVQVARSVFSNIIIHLVNVANLIAFDLTSCYMEGTVFLAPGVDVFGTASSSTGWDYDFPEVLTVLGPTFFPLANVTTKFNGTGKYFITGGNYPSTLSSTAGGDLAAPSLNMAGSINDEDGNEILDIAKTTSAVNHLRITNSATANWPTLSATGTDTHVGMYLFPKGSSGQVILADHNVNEVLEMNVGTASAVNHVAITNAATGNDPVITAKGGDTNIDLNLTGKGTGVVQAGGVAVATISGTQTLTNKTIDADNNTITVDQEFWFEPRYTSGNFAAYGDYTTYAIGTTSSARFSFAIPAGFSSLTAIEVIVIPDASETIQYDVLTDYAAVGQAHTTHSGSITNGTLGVTANQIAAVDISSTVSSLAAGDLVGIDFQSDTDFIYVLGLRVKMRVIV